MKRGLVVGKFYPFHSGHAHLIQTAKEQSDALTVLVCDRSDQVFTGEERASWIRESFSDVTVRVIRDIGHDDDSEMWARYTIAFLGYAPDTVFTSEAYGDAYAKYMGAKHVCVDRKRKTMPISGTRIRKDPYRYWKYVSAPVRARLVRRVAIVGAESTGKTTLAGDLAKSFRTVWVPEFGRLYSEGKFSSNDRWRSDEFVFIAEQQNRMEDFFARVANRILFCDTNAWATRVWHERYMGSMSAHVGRMSGRRAYDLVLVTDASIPFVQDGLRDGERIRHSMHERFLELLRREHIPHVFLSGSRQERLRRAIEMCQPLLLPSKENVFGGLPGMRLGTMFGEIGELDAI